MSEIKFSFLERNSLVKKIAFSGNSHTTVSIGKSDTDILFNSKDVSRLHAQLVYDGNRVYIQDCESTNGTFVNGTRIPSGQLIGLKSGDTVMFSASGDSKMVIGDTAQAYSIAPNATAAPTSSIGSLNQYLINKEEITVGRAPECDVVLSHHSISRVHASIRKVGNGRFKVTDLGSTNGTFVNGRKITSIEVGSNDRLFVGRFQLSFDSAARNLSTESAIRANNVSKVYSNGFTALKQTSFDIPSGGLVAIMGPSGCGKSTLLKVLNGDSPASTGNVMVHGLDLIENYDYLKTQIGYVPQDDIVHRELTVEQSIYYAAKIRLDGISDEETDQKIDRLLRALNITEIRNNLVSAISGGQRKRVSIAVELLSDPAILFLDEPTSPLDPQTIEEFMGILRSLSAGGTTVVIVTHKPDDLNHMDSVIFMAEGGYMVYYGGAREYKSYFNVSAPVEVYANIAGEKAKYWINKMYAGRNNPQMPPANSRRPSSDVNVFRQFFWLLSRYLKIKTNDKLNSAIMLLQAPIIALLICIIFPDIRISVPFLMAVSAIWFGVNNAAREIVAELPIYKRERMFNVVILPYVFSKVTVLGLFAFLQAVMFNLIIWMCYSGSLSWNDPLSGILWMFFITVCSSLFGLLISSGSNNTEKVMSIVPIAIIPQIMLAGIVAPIQNMGVEFMSYFTFSRWGTEGFAHIQGDVWDKEVQIDTTLLATQPDKAAQITDVQTDAFAVLEKNYDSSYGNTFGDLAGTLSLDFFVVLTLALLCLIGIWISLKKKDSI